MNFTKLINDLNDLLDNALFVSVEDEINARHAIELATNIINAQRVHSASNPPDNERDVLCLAETKKGRRSWRCCYYADNFIGAGVTSNIKGWMELPSTDVEVEP